MLKVLRKNNKWFMVGFGVLLMVAWLVMPAFNQVAKARLNRTVATFDGGKISQLDMMTAGKELSSLVRALPWLVQTLGIQERDTVHWLLLSRAAQDSGYMGGPADGREYLSRLAQEVEQQRLQSDFQYYFSVIGGISDPATQQKAVQEAIQSAPGRMMAGFQQELAPAEVDMLFARLAAVERMRSAYVSAARVSDRRAARVAKEVLDAVVADYVFVPSSLKAGDVADPDEAALAAHFEQFKWTKPGEGDYGIGYLLPERIKLEWMTLSRKAMEDAVSLDPVEIRKRYSTNRTRYPGEFAAERMNVERDMKAEVVNRAMQSAQLVVQSEVLKATRRLEPDGRYKVLPQDWEQTRPRYESIAQAVVDELRKTGLNIPLPEVVIRTGAWLTREDLSLLPGIGRSGWSQGTVSVPFTDVVSATRELGGKGTAFPVQVGIPVAEHPLQDWEGNRYYITVLGARGESAPDSVADIREKAVKDYKDLRAFEKLRGETESLRQIAVGGGLDAVATAVAPPPTATLPPSTPETPVVKRAVEITRDDSRGETVLDAAVRAAVTEAAEGIDPVTPYGQAPAEKATVVAPSAKNLGVAVLRILAVKPLTLEQYRLVDRGAVAKTQQDELTAEPGAFHDPFSLASLLRRHNYSRGEERVTSTDQISRDEDDEG